MLHACPSFLIARTVSLLWICALVGWQLLVIDTGSVEDEKPGCFDDCWEDRFSFSRTRVCFFFHFYSVSLHAQELGALQEVWSVFCTLEHLALF